MSNQNPSQDMENLQMMLSGSNPTDNNLNFYRENIQPGKISPDKMDRESLPAMPNMAHKEKMESYLETLGNLKYSLSLDHNLEKSKPPNTNFLGRLGLQKSLSEQPLAQNSAPQIQTQIYKLESSEGDKESDPTEGKSDAMCHGIGGDN